MADLAADTDQGDLDFNSGFTDTPTTSPAAPAQDKVSPETPAAKEQTPIDKEPKAPEAERPSPEYVQLTKEDHATLMAAAAKTASFEGQFSKLFGTMGNVQQLVTKLQSQTPAGEKVEVPKIAFAKLREAFPEVADLIEADMAEQLKGLRGTGPDDAPGASLTTDDVRTVSRSLVMALQEEALEEEHPNWREIVGTVDEEGKHDPNNEFRKWLATQPADYQTKINSTNSAVVISKAIDKFQASKASPAQDPATPAPKAAARRDRIQDAVQPKGDGGQPPPAKTANDEFDEGFKSG